MPGLKHVLQKLPGRGLQGIETVVQREEHVAPKGNNQCLLSHVENGGPGFLEPSLQILDRLALSPRGKRRPILFA